MLFFQTPHERNEVCAKEVFLKNGFVKFRNMAWFTNIEHPYRHKKMELKTMSGLCKFLSVKSIIHEKGPSMVYKQKVEFPLPIFGFATN